MFEGDVEEVAAAAGGVEHAQGAQAVMKAAEFGAGGVHLGVARAAVEFGGFVGEQQRGGLGVGPFAAQGFHHGGQHEAFDVGARGVVGAEGVAFGGVERAFEQGAEDGGLDFAPVGAGGGEQQIDLRAVERQRISVVGRALEQLAVEAQHGLRQGDGEAAAVHVGPEGGEHALQGDGVVAVALEQGDEAALVALPAFARAGQQADVFGKHREQAAGEVGGDKLRGVAAGFERAGEFGQLRGDFAGDAGAGAGGVEAERVEPDAAQGVAHLGAGEVGERDAVAARIGKRGVGGAAAGEFGVKLDHLADIDHEQKGRTAARGEFGGFERAGVALGLGAGAQQGVVESAGVGAGTQLFGFEHEGAAPVAVDAAGAAAAVAVAKGDGPLEHVVEPGRGVRHRHAEQLAQLAHEALRGGEFGGGNAAPAGDEVGGAGGVGLWDGGG